jgi:hypothetical protein
MLFSHEKGENRPYILVRKQTALRPEGVGKLLFEDMPIYQNYCYATNMDLPLDQIGNMYNSRADCENRIKELNEGFGLENFCLKNF